MADVNWDHPCFQLPPTHRGRRFFASEVHANIAQWPLTRHRIPEDAWAQGHQGEGVRVGIVDTGIDRVHRATGDLVGQIATAESFVSGESVDDENGHSTHCAGIIAALVNNVGTAGVSPAVKLVIAKGLNNSGSGTLRSVLDAMIYCRDQGCHIISMSLGTSADIREFRELVALFAQQGILIVAAAGNGSGDGVDFPGAYFGTLGVGAIDRRDELASFSDRGAEVDLVAPGVDVPSTISGGDYANYSGTSMSAPFVAGLAALRLGMELKVYGEFRTRHISDWRTLLDKSTKDLGEPGRDPGYGRGVVDVKKLLAVEDQPPPPPDDKKWAARWPNAFGDGRGMTIIVDGDKPEFVEVT